MLFNRLKKSDNSNSDIIGIAINHIITKWLFIVTNNSSMLVWTFTKKEWDFIMHKKILFVSHTANFSKFNRPFMRWFKGKGYEVHYASAGEEEVLDCDKHYSVPFERNPFSKQNFTAYKMLKKVIDSEQYNVIHCHTPVGGVITRLAARSAHKRGTSIIYTAHGFHFYKGSPFKNWMIYYPIEKFMSRYTDCLVVLNQEDYNIAVKNKFRAKKIIKIDGVGVDLDRFHVISNEEKKSLREEYGFKESDYIIIYVAEFIERKNHAFFINCLPHLIASIPNLKVVFAGDGITKDSCIELSNSLELQHVVHFLGYRRDIDKLYPQADILVTSSKQEGLPINVLEGMASGLPIVCTRIRGHVDVVKNDLNGYLFDINDSNQFKNCIIKLYDNPEVSARMSKQNLLDVQRFSLENAINDMAIIYNDFL